MTRLGISCQCSLWSSSQALIARSDLPGEMSWPEVQPASEAKRSTNHDISSSFWLFIIQLMPCPSSIPAITADDVKP